MASIWFQCLCHRHEVRKIYGGMKIGVALERLAIAAADWTDSERTRAAVQSRRSVYEYDLYERGVWHGSLWLDQFGPPSGAEQWDRRRWKAKS
jgi:hypothetical protein